MRFHRSITQNELSKRQEPASGDHKKVNRELLVEKKMKEKIKNPSVESLLARGQIQAFPSTSGWREAQNSGCIFHPSLLEVCPGLWSLQCSGHGTASVGSFLVCLQLGSHHESGLASNSHTSLSIQCMYVPPCPASTLNHSYNPRVLQLVSHEGSSSKFIFLRLVFTVLTGFYNTKQTFTTLVFETGFCYAAPASLELIMQNRLSSSSLRSACLGEGAQDFFVLFSLLPGSSCY